jgi:hypothetical protein
LIGCAWAGFPISTLNPVTNGGNAWPIDQLSLETLMNLGPHNYVLDTSTFAASSGARPAQGRPG